MRGAIIGDVVGSIHERTDPGNFPAVLLQDSCRFTDDTVCTIAIADAILRGTDFGVTLKTWCLRYPNAGYGGMFKRWLAGQIADGYGSYGNGGPMRVSPCAWLAKDSKHAQSLAEASCAPTHNHPNAVRSAQAVVQAIRTGRASQSKDFVLADIEGMLSQRIPRLEALVANGKFDIEADLTVLNAAACILEADSFEDVLRNAIYIGGDVDTNAAIAGSIAETFLPVPPELWTNVEKRLPEDVRQVLARFDAALDQVR